MSLFFFQRLLSRVSVLTLAALGAVSVLVPMAHTQSGGRYDRPGDGWADRDYYGDYNDRRYSDRDYDEMIDEKRQLALEREQFEREQEALQNRQQERQARSDTGTTECPAGFQQSERKCTPQERLSGCQDIRLPSGQGCVKRDR